MDFFDVLQTASLVALNAYFAKKLQKEHEREKFVQSCYQETANAAEKMANVILNAVTRGFRADFYPKILADGTMDIPIYSMLCVLKKQRGISKEQSEIVDLFFRNLSTSYSKTDFLQAVKGFGSLEQQLKNNVGYNAGEGAFWNLFFSVVSGLDDRNKIVEQIVRANSDFIMNFSALSAEPNAKLNAQILIDHFISSLGSFYEQSVKNPQYIDYSGKHGWQWYKESIEKTAFHLIEMSGDKNELDMQQLLDNLFETLLYNFIRQTTQSEAGKREDYCFILGVTGTAKLAPADEIYSLASMDENMINFYGSFPVTFIQIIQTMGVKANLQNEADSIVRSTVNFLMDIERIMVKRKTDVGYVGLASAYLSEVLSQVLNQQEE